MCCLHPAYEWVFQSKQHWIWMWESPWLPPHFMLSSISFLQDVKEWIECFFTNFSCLSRVLLPLSSLYLTHWPMSSEYAICSLSKIDFSEPFSTRPSPLSPSPPASNGFLKLNKMCIERGYRLETKSPLDVEVRYRPHFYSANTVNLAPLERVREGWYC